MDRTTNLARQIVKEPNKDMSRQNEYAEEKNYVATKETLSLLNQRRMHREQVAIDYCILQQRPTIKNYNSFVTTLSSRDRECNMG